ncbi:MAG: PaaI family thioesterase [Victivallales bacterium]|nr:PaaI family thioesterase [Victivallales bacterium]MBR5839804.1 PaaI family thioesterase [Victivallales bacterium]
MGTFKTIDEAREYFKDDGFASANGIILEELDDAHALTSVILTHNHRNALGGVMGGAIFTLADFAFAALSNQLHMGTVAQQISINYLSAPKGDRLIAKAVCRKNGRNSCVINVDVTDDTGRDIAQFVGTGFKLQ